MTAYVRINRLPDLPTTGYTFEDQIAVEVLALRSITEAMNIAMLVAKETQPTVSLRRAIVLTDRSALDGRPYSTLRTPNEDQEMVDFRKVETETIGWDTHPEAKTRVHPIRKWHRDFMTRYCDVAFILDHEEVPFEDNGFRQTDLSFRQTIAVDMEQYYRDILGDRVLKLHGNPDERKAKVIKHLTAIAKSEMIFSNNS